MKRITLAITLLLAMLSSTSCRKTVEEQALPSTEKEYEAAVKLLNAKQKDAYLPQLPAREENRIVREVGEERIRLAVYHAATSVTALGDVINAGGMITREQVKQVYGSLGKDVREDELGKAIKRLADNKGVMAGDQLPRFAGVGVDGKPFDWSVTDGKRVLLIYEGWGWIKRSTHFWFKDLLAATDRDSLAVVAYVYAGSLAELQKRVKSFQLEPYYVISDLKGKEGPLDKKMGIRGIPTYYYTDRQGRVRRVVSGFDQERFTYYTGLSPEWGENWTED